MTGKGEEMEETPDKSDSRDGAVVTHEAVVETSELRSDFTTKRREFLELTARREVASAYASYEAAARASEIYRVGVRGQAGQNLSVIRKTYELGSKTLLEYIAEQRRYIELENDYVDSLLETYRARVRVALASAAPELLSR